MTSLHDYADAARHKTLAYEKCSAEQALVYACEDIVEEAIGSQHVPSHEAHSWLEHVCEIEDVDPPRIEIHRESSSFQASSSVDQNALCLRGKTTTRATLLHELAHLMSDGHSHGVLFRDELVRLSRAHLSVEFAALLHGVYQACGLEVSPWPASAQRR